MKIPDEIYIGTDQIFNTGGSFRNLYDVWCDKAIEIGIEHGIYVAIGGEWSPKISGERQKLTRIYFKALDREFETSEELLRVIKLKAFL